MAEFDPETELTDEEIARVLTRKPKWLVPALISLGSIGLIAVIFYFGGSILPKGETPVPMLMPPIVKTPTEDVTETLHDTIDIEDLGADSEGDSTDSLHQYIRNLLATPIDTTQMAELPLLVYDTISGILSARVDPEDLIGDTTIPFIDMLVSPLRNDIMEIPKMPWEMEEPKKPVFEQHKDTVVAPPPVQMMSAKDKKALEKKQAEIDSLSLQLSAAERALAKTSEERTILADKMDRIKPSLDSTRTAELKRFSKILETMKPGQAAQLLAGRSPDEVSEILFRLKPKTAAAILQNLPPQLATDIAARVVRR